MKIIGKTAVMVTPILLGVFWLMIPRGFDTGAVNAKERPGTFSAYQQTHANPEIAEIREEVFPAMVNIRAVQENFSGGRAERTPVVGSGVIVSAQGHMITNYHVVRDATEITITLPDGEQASAEILSNDPLTDLAVLKLDLDEFEDDAVPYAEFGDSGALNVGDQVVAMGNPAALSSSMSMGIVSNPEQVMTDPGGTDIEEIEFEEGEISGIFTQWIQHDALIIGGNSGGPLVNMNGEVVGINAMGVGGFGGGFGLAIPSNLAESVYENVLEHGEVPRGWLGVRVTNVDQLGREDGALVSWILPGSPAEELGLQPGDVLLSVNGEAMDARFLHEVPEVYRKISEQQPNAVADVTFERNGSTHTEQIELEEMEPYTGPEFEVHPLGATFREITNPMALNFQLETSEALYVTGVRSGFPLEEASPGIRSEDVITHIDGEPVRHEEEIRKILAGIDEQREELPVRLYRDNEEIVSVVELEASAPTPPAGDLPDPWIGIDKQVMTQQVAATLNKEGVTGFRVTEVFDNTNAAASGLQQGDIITAIEDSELQARRERDRNEFERTVDQFEIGETVTLHLLRDGEERQVETELEATPASPSAMPVLEQEQLEFAVREPAFEDRLEQGWPEQVEGVMVSDVTSGGWAHLGGLRRDDKIRTVQGEQVSDIESFETAMQAVLEEEPEVIRLFVQREHRTDFVFIDPDWQQIIH